MTITTVNYVHLEDEVSRLNWIPGSLRDQFYLLPCCEGVIPPPMTSTPPNGFAFTLTSQGPTNRCREINARVTYRFFEDRSQFITAAMATLAPHEVTVAIIDLMLPDEQGKHRILGDQVYQELRKRGFPKTRMIVLSAYANEQVGLPIDVCDGHIVEKPADPDDLGEKLLRAGGLLPYPIGIEDDEGGQ